MRLGNSAALLETFIQAAAINLRMERQKVLVQFQNNLSFEAYARQVQLMADSF
jgi:hypothetical protein